MSTSETPRPIALISGGTGGVGDAVSSRLADAGYDIAFTFNSNTAKANALSARLSAAGSRVHARPVDLTNASAVEEYVASVVDAFGRIDAVIHASGPYVEQRYVSTFTSAQFRQHVDQELIALFELARTTLPHLRDSSGSLTAVTSVGVRRFPAKDALSSVPKGGMEALIRAIALEEGRYGVRANAVAPGVLGDGMMDMLAGTGDVPAFQRTFLEETIPLRRLGRAAEVADAVCFMVSPAAAYITGQSLDIDGGYSL
ncbi:SDR family NAD(P)-dependent oxidoreductase [Microbacterium alcoholitolerans]|uniref:SDR family NAD(P)-dependent oxidoreductase n=1 Tax=unclassified Microbacterium TaxID=2609290 RepID=UPI003D182244